MRGTRWLALILIGTAAAAVGLAVLILRFTLSGSTAPGWGLAVVGLTAGGVFTGVGLVQYTRIIANPEQSAAAANHKPITEAMRGYQRRHKGTRVVAIGGGTGLPTVLRALKPYTGNLSAVVTVADDGGSSGRLRRELGVLPPGDLRNNIVALADDENIMARLFQYRFNGAELDGHAFGNLFIAALAGVTGSIEQALIETARVLNIQGRVLPSTLQDVTLAVNIRMPGKRQTVHVEGESQITAAGGVIEQITLIPPTATAYDDSVLAILEADIVVIGPGSLYTSILPNLLVNGIREALRATTAYKIYLCNVATQPGESDGFSVAEHVMTLEQYIGRGVFQAVLANDHMPTRNAGEFTRYVQTVSPHHEIAQRYEVRYFDLTDDERPWRHSPEKLAQAILSMRDMQGTDGTLPNHVVST
jgi:uncharacterized cofD-like protein